MRGRGCYWETIVAALAIAVLVVLGSALRAPAEPLQTIPQEDSRMTFDQSKIGQVVAAQMEALEGRYGEECEIGNVCTIVEVLGPHGSDVSVRSSEARPHTTIGLLRMAEAMLLNRLGTAGRGEEE
jgi:hypothetical protein